MSLFCFFSFISHVFSPTCMDLVSLLLTILTVRVFSVKSAELQLYYTLCLFTLFMRNNLFTRSYQFKLFFVWFLCLILVGIQSSQDPNYSMQMLLLDALYSFFNVLFICNMAALGVLIWKISVCMMHSSFSEMLEQADQTKFYRLCKEKFLWDIL